MSPDALLHFAGGVGLFLLGMRLMSDGLKVAAGPALRGLLSAATASRARGVASGVLITALVQSSSAVIFATIGFVNAGLMNLAQAVGVVFGANVGTTLTSWIVALVGFNVDLQVLAMPAVALGMGLWILGGGRRAALGQALVGFGIFFLGLDALKGSFAGIGTEVGLDALPTRGLWGILLFAAVGGVLTVLMQSSSATLAVTLTAAAGGLVPLTAAAAMVVGAKVGTTSTALFAVIGATPDARRAAAAHVAFSLLTAAAALPMLPLLLEASRWTAAHLGLETQPATVLAIFHTLSALLGLALIWPFTDRLVAWLGGRFARGEADEGQPRHLDRHVLGTPRLALDALDMELRRLAVIAHRMARSALSNEADDARLAAEQAVLDRLAEAVIGYAGSVPGGGDAVVDAALPNAVRVAQYYRGMAERAEELGRTRLAADLPPDQQALVDRLHRDGQAVLDASQPRSGTLDLAALDAASAGFEAAYQEIKATLLRAGGRGELGPATLVRILDRASFLRRILDQARKAAHCLATLERAADDGGVPAPGTA
ncbi:Na/Pi cotransporter family protein [Coralloluteibacterium thermophilus]|uniref:Na/Pi cotransporter family protein n=1 Tax=Coralloluteibacterium thermophilum TaxID=2707049 RepID=A0ABV9NM42_9GAMM